MPMMMLENEWWINEPTPPAIATPPTALQVSSVTSSALASSNRQPLPPLSVP